MFEFLPRLLYVIALLETVRRHLTSQQINSPSAKLQSSVRSDILVSYGRSCVVSSWLKVSPLILLLFEFLISFQVILMIRTWAVWRLDPKVGSVLAILQIATVVSACYGNIKFSKSLQSKYLSWISKHSVIWCWLSSFGSSLPWLPRMLFNWKRKHDEVRLHCVDCLAGHRLGADGGPCVQSL